MRSYRQFGITIAMVLLTLVAIPGIASAHEKRTVAGKYTFVVGFLNEPAIVEQPNGIDPTFTDASTNQPIEGLEKSLKTQIIIGGESENVTLSPRFGMPGKYTANVIPTKAGTWKFHFSGKINSDNLDETFTSGPGRFNDVESKDALQFPVKEPATLELANQAATAKAAADSAKSSARTGMMVGIVGIVVGLLGLGVAGIALQQARRARDSALTVRPERRMA
ncbi:MAG: hypothetical protein ACR2PL_17475 [Dehalococcoidia bacterium]